MEINEYNYKEVLLQWLEGELTPTEVLQAEAYLLVNDTAAREWHLLQRTRLQPQKQVYFPKKHLLLKSEEEEIAAPASLATITGNDAVVKPISAVTYLRRIAVPLSVAASLLLVFLFTLNKQKIKTAGNDQLVRVEKTEAENIKKATVSIAGTTDKITEQVNLQPEDLRNVIVPEEVNNVKKAGLENKITKKPAKVFSEEAIYAKATHTQQTEPSEAIILQPITIDPVQNTEATAIANVLSKETKEKLKNENKFVALAVNEAELSTLNKVRNFFTKTIQIKKQTEDDVNYYALRVETDKIRIVKTFKSNF